MFLLFGALPAFGQCSSSSTAQIKFECDLNSVGYWASQTKTFLIKAGRTTTGTSSQTYETEITQAVLDVWAISTVVDRDLMWANIMTEYDYSPPSGNATPTPFAQVNSTTCSGTTYYASGTNPPSNLVATIQCDITNLQTLINTANTSVNAVPSNTGDGTFNNDVQTAQSRFSSLQSSYTTVQTDASNLPSTLSAPSESGCSSSYTLTTHCLQDALFYSFLAQYFAGTEGGGISQGHTINELVAEVQSGTTYSLSIDMNIIDNLNQMDSMVRNAYIHVIPGIPEDGSIIFQTSTPLQYAVGVLLEPTNDVPYRFGTDEDLIGDIGYLSHTPLDQHLSNSAKYLGNGWRGSDGAAYTILDALLIGCTN